MQRNASDARGWLVAADTALTSAVQEMTRARTLVISANSGASDPNARKAIADDLRALREGLVQLANSKYLNRPIFAGNGRRTYAPDGTYLGDDGVDPGRSPSRSPCGQPHRSCVRDSNPGDPMSGNVFERLTPSSRRRGRRPRGDDLR